MAEDDKRKLDIPWATLLPVIAVLAGIVAQFKPLVSTRPAVPSEKSIEVFANQDVDARLWQDPLAVAQKEKAALEADLNASHRSDERAKRHQIDALVKRINDSIVDARGKVLLLAVMVNSGPYLEQAESRLRTRQAVLEGLSESEFVPVDSEHIGFVTAPWPPDSTASAGAGALLIPWEECRAAKTREDETEGVFILWLPAADFNPKPLVNFAALVKWFVPPQREKLDVKLIGPANSTGLEAMLREVHEERPRDPKQDDLLPLDGVTIISPRATASDAALLSPPNDGPQPLVKDVIERAVPPGKRGGLRFVRTIATDDIVLQALVKELALRNVNVAPHKDKKQQWVDGDHIVILTEWDTPYGRSLGKAFESAAKIALPEDASSVAPRIQQYVYLHGIDGRLPGDPKESPRSDSQKDQAAPGAVMTEATEGLNQSDFLRRLALRLKDQNAILRREGKEIRGVGLLGSDVFDKLMILRALRPEFPNAIFFTDNFDAHFDRREDWDDTHNLVIASPFGSTLPGKWQSRIAPFRDNYQTATYVATLFATDKMKENDVKNVTLAPRIFEISRKGAYEFDKRYPAVEDIPSDDLEKYWFRDWLASDWVRYKLAIGSFALLLIVEWIGLSLVDQRLPGGGSSRERLKRVCSSTAFWLTCGVPVIVTGVAWLSQQGTADEPLAFFSGISIWPSEMLRLIALLLAVHFMIRASVDLGANEREVTRRFFPGSPPSEKWHWRNPRLGLRRWQKEHPDWGGADTPFSAKDAWFAYLVRNQFWPRFIRIGTLFVIYFCFSVAVSRLFPHPVTPARGPIAFTADTAVLYPTVIAMMILTFYVVDAIRLNSNFIRIFTYGVTTWEPGISLGRERIPPLEEKELSRYRDIFFVAQRTEVVAPLIWYPLIVLTVMFLARSSFFDNWTWPLSLILIFTLNAMWAIGSAVFLRRAAEQLREAAISNLQLRRVLSFKEPEKQRTFDELIAEIRRLKKGAFAPLTEQPFVRAIVYPSGGLGLLAVGQRLLDIF